MCTLQTHPDTTARVLTDVHNEQALAASSTDRSVLYVGVVAFDCIVYTVHRCVALNTLLVLSHERTWAIQTCGAVRRPPCTVDFCELAVCVGALFLPTSRDRFCLFLA